MCGSMRSDASAKMPHCIQIKPCSETHRKRRLSPNSASAFPATIIAKFGDYSRQYGQGLTGCLGGAVVRRRTRD